ncbi:RNase3 domain-containing protein [Poronia punctata]|nr:RNase3 domain-containing protein [Poronia punctata]
MEPPTRKFTAVADEYDDSSSEDSSSLELIEATGGLEDRIADFDEEETAAVVVDVSNQELPSSDQVEEQTIIHARAYQTEMFEESLKRNIIVAMDTGSGKTQVAVLRIQAELEKRSDKIIWFLAPTIPLCEQQFRVLKSQIRAIQIKMLSGSDGVDTWSDVRIWDDYLKNVRIVVSTHQVLLDAITHAFVPISRLSLIVFDEAHHCVGNHPGSKIMERYRMAKAYGMAYPAILGLTASPIMKSDPKGIDRLEQTLDAVCKSPNIHREELIAAVKRPSISSITLPPSEDDCVPTPAMLSLAKAFRSLNIYDDPYILYLQSEGTMKSLSKLQNALSKRDTYTTKQLQSLYRTSCALLKELGPWAADYYIYTSITRFFEADSEGPASWEAQSSMTSQEREYMAVALKKVNIQRPTPFEVTSTTGLSVKFIRLVQQLQSIPEGARCIVFVREVATVSVLGHMLSSTTSLQSRFRVGTVVGTSVYGKRKRELGDVNVARDGLDLEDFRSDKINLLLSTSVAEEGIDVPACNYVICFNAPDNVKSFIQRRGRARADNSKLILLLEESSDKIGMWMYFEQEMKKRYEDDMRVAQELAELENLGMDPAVEPLVIPSTGARLHFGQAKAHLQHFCSKTNRKQYIDSQPFYISRRVEPFPGDIPRFNATVYLPPSLPPPLRQVRGLQAWYSENNAFEDAAFQAFKAVYEAGLVNDHLMPLIDDILEGIETRSSIIEVDPTWTPWPDVARLWGRADDLIQREICLRDGSIIKAKFDATLPRLFPVIPPFDIYWDTQNTWKVEVSNESHSVTTSALKKDQSAALLDLAYSHRWPVENSAHVLHLQSDEDLTFRHHAGQRSVEGDTLDPNFLVRNRSGAPYVYIARLPSRPSLESTKKIERGLEDEPEDLPWLAVSTWQRRPRNLLCPLLGARPLEDGRYPRAIPLSQCTVDSIDRSKVDFGAIIPSILYMLGVYLIAEELRQSILAKARFSSLPLLVTAVSSRAAGLGTDYERLEFMGDSILKLAATLSVMIEHPNHPEGFLSACKDRIVSNSRLCRASVDQGLHRFILNERFRTKGWRPHYIKDLIAHEETPPPKKQISTKTLADVVESLIGAAFQEGGMSKALICMGIFLPEVKWYDLPRGHMLISNTKQIKPDLPPQYKVLEDLIGYEFRNKTLLLEAITHGSWNLYMSTESSMERLEFLGDAILDNVITTNLWNQKPVLKNHQMHLLRTATVNADLLGFLVMEWHIMQETTSISQDADHTTTVTQSPVFFWQFMRKGSAQLSAAQRAAEERHAAHRDTVLDAITRGKAYPWALLAHIAIPKFFSDMFEALLGAIWVDSGSLEACTAVVERVGITPYLRRILADDVAILHPKNTLGILAGSTPVRYETEWHGTEHACSVFVDDKFVVRVTGGVSREEVITKAADEACRVLGARDDDMMDEIMTG